MRLAQTSLSDPTDLDGLFISNVDADQRNPCRIRKLAESCCRRIGRISLTNRKGSDV